MSFQKVFRFLERLDGIEQRVAHKVHLIVELLEKIFLKRENHKHLVHIFLDAISPFGIPSPYFGRDVVKVQDLVLLTKFGNTHIEAPVVNEYHYVGLISQNILLRLFDKAQNTA